MNCPGCGGVNRDGARFCIGCGASLALRCQSCGNELPPQARFCDGCGSPVTGEPEVAEPVAAARKVVTVVFADITGSTALEERLDAEAVRALLDRIYAALRKDVEDYGGRVVKFTGDGLMAAFGVPEVGEDDAGQAAAAAVAMLQTMAGIAAETAHTLALKAGINTGEVVVIEEDDDVVGDSVNVASRLEGAAGSGEILVGETTWRLTRSSFAYEAIDPLLVKGKSEPVPAYRLLSVAAVADEVVAPPFVGRDGELSRLLEVFDEAVEANAARLVTIVGSPGVGKTRLAHELAAHLAGRAMVREARCDPAAATFAPIAETIREAGAIQEAASEQEILDALEAMLPEDEPDRDRIATYVGAVLGAGKPGSTEQTFWALRKLIETRAAADVPRVLILDDLHWAEPLLLDLVEHLAEWIRAAPVLLVGTGRPELRDKRPSLAEGGRAAAVISLEGLDYESTEQLAMGLLGTQDVPTELLARIPSSTEGNPLFVRELVRMLVDDGILRREDDAWRLTVDVEAVEVPPTIQSLLAARMDRLEADERTVLELASVIGKEFYRGAVAELAAPAVREVLEECLERLRRKELVEPVGTYWIDEPVYRFHHALIRDAAYRRLLKETRADLHERVATWFEAKTSGLVGEHEEAIGYHLEQAHEYKRQLGKQDDELGARAAELLGTATRRALDRDDLPGAAALAGRALERLPEGEQDERAELLLMRCEALLSMGDVTHGAPAVDDFLSLATTPRLSAWAACFSGQLANLTAGGLPHTETSVAAAAGQLTELGDMAGAAKAHTVRATALAGLGRYGECEAALDEALTAARQAEGRRRSVTATLGTAPQAQVWGPNPVSRAGGRCLDLVRLLRITTGSLAVEQTSMRCQAVLEAFRGRADAARGMLRRARRKLTELGLEHELLETEQFAGFVELVAGDAAAALPHLEAAHEGFRRFGSDVLAAQTASLLAFAHVYVGEVEEAEAYVDEAERLASRDLRAAMAWRTAKAEVLARRGLFEEARALAEEAALMGEPTDALVDHGMAYRQLAAVLRAAGDAAGAQRAEERAFALFERKGATALMGEPITHPRPAQLAAVPGSGPPENEAIRQIRRFDELWAARDWDGIVALWAEDVVQETRLRLAGSLEGPFLGRQALREWLDSMATIGVASYDTTPLATRGERLALVRKVARGPDPESTFEGESLAVSEFNEKGRLKSSVAFESDDLDGALAELDERYIAGEGRAFSDDIRLVRKTLDAMNQGDWNAYMQCIHPDIIQIDHRPVSLGRVEGRDAHVRALSELARLIPRARFYIPVVYRQEPGTTLVKMAIEGTTPDGSPIDVSFLGLYSLGEGRLVHMEMFAVDALDAALARYEELTAAGDGPLENACVRVVRRALELLGERDWDRAAEMYREDVVGEDRRHLSPLMATGRAEALEHVKSIADVVDLFTVTPIATRGERLALVRMELREDHGRGVTFPLSWIQVDEIDEDGRFRAFVSFEVEDLDDAFAELDERYLAGEGVGYDQVGIEWTRAVNERNWTLARELMADDCVFSDRRPVSFGELDADRYLESLKELAALVPDFRIVTNAVLAFDSDIALTNTSVVTLSDPVNAHSVICGVAQSRDGRMARICAFSVDQLEEARATYEELMRESAPTTRVLQNEASRAALRWADLATTGRWEELASHLGPHHQRIDRRQGLGSVAGRDEVIEGWKVILELGPARHDMRVLATRGERLALLGGTISTSQGFEIAGLVVAETDADGHLFRVVLLDEDAHDAAFDELDERFIAGEGAPFADVVETNATVFALWNARDFQAATTHIDPGFVLVDHRPLGFGTVEGVEPFMEVANSLAEVAPRARRYFSRYHALADGVALVEQVSRASPGPDTDEIVYQFVVCVENGRWKRGEVFPEDDLDAARACYESLVASAPSGPPENSASRTLHRFDDTLLRGDWDAMREVLRPDAVMDDRRPVMAARLEGADAILENFHAVAAVGVLRSEPATIAVRGERLALCRVRVLHDSTDDPFVNEAAVVVEVDHEGRVRSFDLFELDDLDAAIHELDERYLAGEGEPFAQGWRVSIELLEGHNARDWARVRAALADDFVLEDHRPMAFVVSSADEMVEIYKGAVELVPDRHKVNAWIEAIDTDHVLMRQVLRGTTVEGAEVETDLWVVGEVRDGVCARTWLYSPEDRAAALARYEQLTAPALSAGPPENECLRVFLRGFERYKAGDLDGTLANLAEDFVAEDRRHLAPITALGREDILEQLRSGEHIVDLLTITPLCAFGERLALVRMEYREEHPRLPFGTSYLQVEEIDEAGLHKTSVTFEEDDVVGAGDELIRRYIAGEGSSFPDELQTIARFGKAVNERDWTTARSCLSDGFVLSDRRPAYFGELSADAWVLSMQEAVDLAPGFCVIPTTFPGLAPGSAWAHLRLNYAPISDTAAPYTLMNFVAEIRDGRFVRASVFSPEDNDAARACFEEYSAPDPAAPPENACTRAVRLWSERFEARDWDGMDALLREDFVWNDLRHIVGQLQGPVVGREAVRAWAEELIRYGVARRELRSLATRGERLSLMHVVHRGVNPDDPEGSWEAVVLQVTEVDDAGLFQAVVTFEEDDLDGAMAELDERFTRGEGAEDQASSAIPVTIATKTRRLLTDAFNRRDFDESARLLTEDFVFEDRRAGLKHTIAGRDGMLENMAVIISLSDTSNVVVPLAVRGELLALHRLVFTGDQDFEAEMLEVTSFDDQGQVTSAVTFDPDDLDAAFAELDECFVAGEGADHADVIRLHSAWVSAWNDRDWTRLASSFAPDYVVIDHRPMSFGTTSTVEEFVEATRTLTEVAPALRMRTVRFHRFEEGICLVELLISGEAEHGGEVESAICGVALHEGGRFTSTEIFVMDDFDRALARYEELSAERTEIVPELSNAATELVRRANDAFNRGDSETFASLLAEDAVHEDRRKGIGHVLTGRDKLVENFEAIHELGSAMRTFTPIAIRGARLVLSLTRYADTEGANEVEMLRINYLDDQGLFGGSIDFDPDDLDAAFADLDERFAAGEGEPFADEVRLLSEFVAAWNARDWDRVAATSIPDLVVVDHRPMGLGRLESVDAFVEATRVLTEMAPDLRMSITRFHDLGPGILAAALPITGQAQHGGQVELGAHIVLEMRAGRAHHAELFGAEDLDRALARYEELRAARVAPGLHNLAVDVGNRVTEAFNVGDREAYARLWAEDVVAEDRRKGLGHTLDGREELLRTIEEMWSLGGVITSSVPIAIRGERLALRRVSFEAGSDPNAPFSVETLRVDVLDDDGKIAGCVVFDPDDLDAAFAELDERFLSGEGAPYADVLRHGAMQRAAGVAGDWDAWRDLIDEDVVLVDHRPTSLGEVRGVEDVLEASRTLVGLVRDARSRVVAYHGLATDRTLLEVLFSGTADHGGEVELSYLRLQQLRDGRVVRIELFPLEDLDAARTRFTELRTASEEPLT